MGGSKLFAHVAGASLRAQKALAAAEEPGPEQDFNEFHHRALPWEPRTCGFPTKLRCCVDSLWLLKIAFHPSIFLEIWNSLIDIQH